MVQNQKEKDPVAYIGSNYNVLFRPAVETKLVINKILDGKEISDFLKENFKGKDFFIADRSEFVFGKTKKPEEKFFLIAGRVEINKKNTDILLSVQIINDKDGEMANLNEIKGFYTYISSQMKDTYIDLLSSLGKKYGGFICESDITGLNFKKI